MVLPLLVVLASASLSAQDDDVLNTKSGSLLRGRVQGLDSGKLAFEDKGLGRVFVPFDQIGDVRLAQPVEMSYQRTYRDDVVTGSLTSPDGRLLFDGDAFNPGNFHRVQRTPFSLWSRHGGFASTLGLTDGNSNVLNYGLNARWNAAHPIHNFDFQGTSLFGKTNHVRSTQRATFQGEYRYMPFEWAGVIVRESLLHDDFRDLRIGAVSFLGLTAPLPLKCGKAGCYEVRVETGLTYTTDEYKITRDREFTGGAAGLSGFWAPVSRVRVDGSSRVNMSLNETRDSRLENRIGIGMEVLPAVHLTLRLEHDYVNLPNPGNLRQDTRLNMLVSWEF